MFVNCDEELTLEEHLIWGTYNLHLEFWFCGSTKVTMTMLHW